MNNFRNENAHKVKSNNLIIICGMIPTIMFYFPKYYKVQTSNTSINGANCLFIKAFKV